MPLYLATTMVVLTKQDMSDVIRGIICLIEPPEIQIDVDAIRQKVEYIVQITCGSQLVKEVKPPSPSLDSQSTNVHSRVQSPMI